MLVEAICLLAHENKSSFLVIFTQAMMAVNQRLRNLYPDSEELFDIVLMTNNHAQVGVRLMNSINHYGRCVILTAFWSGCYIIILSNP